VYLLIRKRAVLRYIYRLRAVYVSLLANRRGYFNILSNIVNKKTGQKCTFFSHRERREKSLSGNQVNRKWISGGQDNRGHSVQRIEILDAGFLSGLENGCLGYQDSRISGL